MNNSGLKVFVMALYATRPDPEFMDVVELGEGRIGYRICYREEEVNLSSPIGLTAHWEVAESEAEAKQMALETALELYPRADGWRGHAVVVQPRSLQESIREAFGAEMGCWSASEDDDEFPEWII